MVRRKHGLTVETGAIRVDRGCELDIPQQRRTLHDGRDFARDHAVNILGIDVNPRILDLVAGSADLDVLNRLVDFATLVAEGPLFRCIRHGRERIAHNFAAGAVAVVKHPGHFSEDVAIGRAAVVNKRDLVVNSALRRTESSQGGIHAVLKIREGLRRNNAFHGFLSFSVAALRRARR